MANSPQARKRAKQNQVRRTRNQSQRATVRTAVKKFEAALEAGDVDSAKAAYQDTASKIDRAVMKGLHHKNRAARLKSRLNKRLKKLAT